MAEGDDIATDDAPKKGGKLKPILVGVLALALGGAGFFVTYSGMLDGLLPGPDHGEELQSEPAGDVPVTLSFVPLDPVVITVGGPRSLRNLRFRAQLQVSPDGAGRAAELAPRIVDIVTTYLRAIPVETLESPTALLLIRSQLLRRLQLLAGPETVTDLLVSEFVID